MDDDGVQPGESQEHHVFGEGTLEVLVDHRVAAVLDDHGRTVEPTQPRQGLDEHAGLLPGDGEPLGGVGVLRLARIAAVTRAGHDEYALFSST